MPHAHGAGGHERFEVRYSSDIARSMQRTVVRKFWLTIVLQSLVLVVLALLAIVFSSLEGASSMAPLFWFLAVLNLLVLAMYMALLQIAMNRPLFADAPADGRPLLVMDSRGIWVAHAAGVPIPYDWSAVVIAEHPLARSRRYRLLLHIGNETLSLHPPALSVPVPELLRASAHFRARAQGR